jgi:HSP20 family protein
LPETNALVKKEAGEVTAPETTRGGIYYTPRVDIYESADEVVLQCDMPGVKPQDVDVRFEKGELSLYGKVQPRQAPAEYLDEEYGIGDFYRSFAVAAETDAEKIAADYRDGVLTVHLAKQERVKPKRIAVKSS